MDYSKIDFASILGGTDSHGHWLDIKENTEEHQVETMSEDNMYLFEGVDYRSTAKRADIDLFDRIVMIDIQSNTGTAAVSSDHSLMERTARRAMTEEEKQARAAKIRETKARRKQEMVGVEFHIEYLYFHIRFRFRKKLNDNGNNEDKQNCNNYGRRTTIDHVASRCLTTRRKSRMNQQSQLQMKVNPLYDG